MTLRFISINGSYNKLEIALFEEKKCVDSIIKYDVKASSHLIPLLDSLLKRHTLSLKDLSFIAVDKGPGAFTSLRVTISTVNGIAFGYKIPLIGINGLEALAQEVVQKLDQKERTSSTIACLLNAYNNDVYYLIVNPGNKSFHHSMNMGSKKIDELIYGLSVLPVTGKFIFVGNAVEVHQQLIQNVLHERYQIFQPTLSLCSAQQIGLMAHAFWIAKEEICDQLTPLYLKTQLFAVKK